MPTKPETWQKRQAAIRDLLARSRVASQTELLRNLEARGFQATQSSVSRDLRELHVAKTDGYYVLPETLVPNGTQIVSPPETFGVIQSIKPAGPNILVVQTPAGSASAVSLSIDAARWAEVVGTVAGDDTIFVATTTRGGQARVLARLSELARIVRESGRAKSNRKTVEEHRRS
jgi:transcriptional regulator of arginine metabolism